MTTVKIGKIKKMYTGKIPQRSFIEQFFTFLVPVEDARGNFERFKWYPEISLRRNLGLYQAKHQQFRLWCEHNDTNSVIQELLRIYQQQEENVSQVELAKWHLAAYLETPVYQAVADRLQAFKEYNSPANTWEHYLHIAKCLACEPEKIAKIYRRHQRGKYSLEQHFRFELASKIRDTFYQETGQGKYSPWFAFKATSKSDLKRALLKIGANDAQIPCYLAIKDALFAVYSKRGKRWLEPTPTQYQEATDYFNRHYVASECPALTAAQPINVARFQVLIKSCLKAIHSSPTVESLDVFSDDLPENPWREDPLTNLERQQSAQEWQYQQQKIDALLTSQIEQLEEVDRKILHLRSAGVKQTEIAAQTGINQATVSRRYQRCQRHLLRALTSWLQEQFALSITTIEVLEHLENYITIWLQRQYKIDQTAQEK